MLKPEDPNFDWNSEEGKQATARLNSFLKHIGKTAPEGFKREAVPLGTDADGEVFGVIVWRKHERAQMEKGAERES